MLLLGLLPTPSFKDLCDSQGSSLNMTQNFKDLESLSDFNSSQGPLFCKSI